MTPKYWTGIAVAILAIFGVGLLVVHGLKSAKSFVQTNLSSFGLMDAKFRVDGDRLGDIQRWQFMRSQPGQVDSAVLTVKLSDDASALHQPDCALRIRNGTSLNGDTRFECTSAEDSASMALVPFGHVELLPEGSQVRLYVAADQLRQIRQHAYRGNGGDSGDVDIQSADGKFSINVNGREIIRASGDSNGGSLVIRDPKTGRPVVQISGDSAGGSVKITDSHGKALVNIHGSGKDSAHKP